MKKTTLLLFLFAIGSMNLIASFPVNKKNVEKANAEVKSLIDLKDASKVSEANVTIALEDALSPAVAGSEDDTFIITILLWFFLGGLAGHRWYAKKPTGWNILFILTLGGLGVWWIIDGINILTKNF